MEIKPHGAFELICIEMFVKSDDILNVGYITNNIITVGSSFDFVTLQKKGTVTFENLSTGEQKISNVGDTNFDVPLEPGEWKINFSEDYEYFCFGPTENGNYLPLRSKLVPFKLMANQSVEIEQGKKLFLGFGSLTINNKTYSGVNRISFSSGNKTVTAIEDSYGFFVQ